METAVRQSTRTLESRDFQSKDGEWYASFLLSVQDERFWFQLGVIDKLCRATCRFSAWLRRCACHEAECKRNRNFRCPWKGCRAPELSARLDECFADFETTRSACGAGAFAEDIHASVTRMMSVLHLKMVWVNELPYFIWQVDSPVQAARFLELYRAHAGSPHHRVSDRFGLGHFGDLMEVWAQDYVLSVDLAVEVSSYRASHLDDTWTESLHRTVSGEQKRVTNISEPWRCATARLQQHLSVWKALSADDRIEFGKLWTRWKAIAQAKPRLARRHVIKRCSDRTAFALVYRLDNEGLYNWKRALGDLVGDRDEKSQAGPKLVLETKLKVDFLVNTVGEHELFSLPDVSGQDVSAILDKVPLDQADAKLHEVSERFLFFSVIQHSVRRKKVLLTQSARSRRSMVMPVSVQFYDARDSGKGGWSLTPQGRPEIVDLLPLVDFLTWRAGLRKWSTTLCDLGGTLCTSGHECIGSRSWPLRDGKTPALVIAEHLHQKGWRRGAPPKEHTSSTECVFRVPNPISAKPYLQCLTVLGELRKDGLSALPSKAPRAYYHLVLQSKKPSEVPIFRNNKAYSALTDMNELDVLEDDALGQEHGHHQFPVASMSVFDAIDDSSVPLKSIDTLAIADDASALYSYLPDKRTEEEKREQSQASVSRGEKRKLPTDSDVPSSVSVVPGTAPPESHPRVKQNKNKRTLVGQICGSDLWLDEWLSPGEAGHYRRYEVECSLPSHSKQQVCRKRRNIGPAQTKMLGDVEPKAFLGAWLELGRDEGTRENHRDRNPTAKEIRDFARRHSLV